MGTNEVQQPDYNLLLNSLLHTNESAPAPIIGAELVATLALEVDRPEWKWLRKEALAGAQIGVAPALGEFAAVQITNVSTRSSPVLMVIESILAWTSGTDQLLILFWGNNAPGPAANKGHWLDSRAFQAGGASRQVVGELSAFALVAQTGSNVAEVRMPTATVSVQLLTAPIILGPASSCRAGLEGASTNLDVCVRWRERALLPSEL